MFYSDYAQCSHTYGTNEILWQLYDCHEKMAMAKIYESDYQEKWDKNLKGRVSLPLIIEEKKTSLAKCHGKESFCADTDYPQYDYNYYINNNTEYLIYIVSNKNMFN